MIINALLILALIAIGIFSMLYIFRKDDEVIDENIDINNYTIDHLCNDIKNRISKVMDTNIEELNLNEYETRKSKENKAKLRKSLKECSYGNIGAKEYIKDYIKDILQKRLKIDEFNIDRVIPFQDEKKLSPQDKFEIILHCYYREYGLNALKKLINDYNLADPKRDSEENSYFEITANDISMVYRKVDTQLEYGDKLSILAQRIYQLRYGHGAIDSIRDMHIDGIGAGVSGIPDTFYTYGEDLTQNDLKNLTLASYNSIWMFFHGVQIHLSFLGFESQKELERVCKNIYRYNNPGHLSAERGYIVNEMKDGTRVVVVRPPFSESWAFFLRKFDSVESREMTELITDPGNEKAIETIKWIFKTNRVSAITGIPGTGKTTLLMSAIQYINPSYAIRIQEKAFEIRARQIYKKRNIETLRETDSISMQEGVDLFKKMDADVVILGEVATAELAVIAMQFAMVGSSMTTFTHHAKTAYLLVKSIRDNLIRAGAFSNEKLAEEQVSELLNFDIHLAKDPETGHRYVERITQIVPDKLVEYPTDVEAATIEFYKRTTDRELFKTLDIVRYEDGAYVFMNHIVGANELEKFLNKKDKQLFHAYLKQLDSEVMAADRAERVG